MRVLSLAAVVAVAPLLVLAPLRAQAPLTPHQQLAREIYKELVEINTTDSTTRAAEAMAARLRAAGFPASDVRVLGPVPHKGNLVARLHGTGARRPLLLLAHLDVVAARREDWSFDPFVFREENGNFYGRGTSDDKAMAAIWIATLVRMKREGFRPDRDIIVALTADEEGGDHNGVDWLVRTHRELIDADAALNEGGGGQLKQGRPLLNAVQASEKVYQSFRLESRNPGGHSSLPVRDNAIYHVADALGRLERFDFPVMLNEVTRGFFARSAALESGPLAADMRAVAAATPDSAAVARLSRERYYNALMRTTCVATMLAGGHAENALPQSATAVVNCRMLPNHDPAEVRRTLERVVADARVTVTPVAEAKPSPPSPLRPDVMGPIERITREMWSVPVVPVMGTGATDGLYLRRAGIPTYGVSGLFYEINTTTAHGRDERTPVKSFYDGLTFLDRVVRALSTAGSATS